MEKGSIITMYNNTLFRSKAEAQWAAFFDACKVKWEYEPQSFELPGYDYYLPDFRVERVDLCNGSGNTKQEIWIEVKGEMDSESLLKIKKFSGYNKKNPRYSVYVVGLFPDQEGINGILDFFGYNNRNKNDNYYNFKFIDGDIYPGYPGVSKKGEFTIFGEDSNYISEMDQLATQDAFVSVKKAKLKYLGEYSKEKYEQLKKEFNC